MEEDIKNLFEQVCTNEEMENKKIVLMAHSLHQFNGIELKNVLNTIIETYFNEEIYNKDVGYFLPKELSFKIGKDLLEFDKYVYINLPNQNRIISLP